ncbi:MAG: PLP-dependent transferase [Planctomycetales bacterium]
MDRNPQQPPVEPRRYRRVDEDRPEHNPITPATTPSCPHRRPFELGVDIVIHSMTKYLNGHSDVVAGCVITREQKHADKISYLCNFAGLACSPFDAWLVLRGLKTLGPLAWKPIKRGSMAVAQFLETHPQVAKSTTPGLTSCIRNMLLAKKQMSGFGGMLAFDVKGDAPRPKKVMTSLKLFSMAESLGGVESLVEYPETMSHASISEQARREAGITENTIRVSIGIEHPDDLIADMKQALES